MEVKYQIDIFLNFLGSTHKAKETKNAGKKYKNDENIYYCNKREKKVENDSVCVTSNSKFTFSGPNIFDIGSLSISNMTKKAQKIISNLLDTLFADLENLDAKIKINIQGHSRGAITARNVYKFINTKYSSKINDEVLELDLNLLDPYAGPINNRFEKNKVIDNDNIRPLSDKLCVAYSLREKLYTKPAYALKAKTVIFTFLSHDKTTYIPLFFPDDLKQKGGTYFFNIGHDEFKKYVHENINKDNFKEELVEKYSKNFNKVTFDNCQQYFKDEWLNKISSNNRKEFFIARILCKVLNNDIKEIPMEFKIKNKKLYHSVCKMCDIKLKK